MCDKGSFIHVLMCHLDLSISRETVHEGEYLVLSGVIDLDINMWKWEVIFGALLVQIPVVYTHSHFTVFLCYQKKI